MEAGKAANNSTAEHSPTRPTSHLILEIGTMIFVITFMSSVGYENRQFGLSELR